MTIYTLTIETENNRNIGDFMYPRIVAHCATWRCAETLMHQCIADRKGIEGWTTENDYAIHGIEVIE